MTEITTTLSIDAIDLANDALDEWHAADRRAAKKRTKKGGDRAGS